MADRIGNDLGLPVLRGSPARKPWSAPRVIESIKAAESSKSSVTFEEIHSSHSLSSSS